MKKALLLLLVVIAFPIFSICAENVLTITNPKSGESDILRKGSFLVFELKADKSTHEGFIREINDSSLVFDYAQVSFSELNILAGTTKSKIAATKIANTLGGVLIVTGSTVFNCGLNFFSYGDYYYWPVGGTIWMAGACVAGLGYMLDWATPYNNHGDHHVRVRNYRGWESHIVKEEQTFDQPKQRAESSDSTNKTRSLNPDKR